MHMLFTLLVLAILANGLYFWLQKSQVLPSSTYQAYLQDVQQATENPALDHPKLELDGLYSVPGLWIATKLLKDIFIFAFAITSILLFRNSYVHFSAPALLIAFLLTSIAFAFFQSVYLYGLWVAVAGARPIAYLVAGLLGMWATRDGSFELLSRYLVAVLVIELILALYEYAFGIPLFYTARTGNRITGSFSFPTSLGVFAITACTLAFSFSNINKFLLLALATFFVYLTGSATALVLLAVAMAMWAVHSAPTSWKVPIRMGSYGMIALILLSLPKLVERYDVFEALWGRIEPAVDYIEHSPSY